MANFAVGFFFRTFPRKNSALNLGAFLIAESRLLAKSFRSSTGSRAPVGAAGRRGKTVQIRRGDAAVIGEAPEQPQATAKAGRPFRIRHEP